MSGNRKRTLGYYPGFYWLILQITALSVFCKPIDDSYIKETQTNFKDTGFLSQNIYQTRCYYNHGSLYIENSPPNWRATMLKACQSQLVIEFGNYRAHYELNKAAKLKNEPEVPLYSKSIDWTDFQKEELHKIFSIFTKGRIVKETIENRQTIILYRVEQNSLIIQLQQTEFPFIL